MNDDIHTSVVIEVENQEEPESQKTYQIDFENLDKQRDYVLDEVFCGENVTVYALLEVPEELVKKPKSPMIKMKNEKIREGYKFQQKNSLKHITEGSSATKSDNSSFMYIPDEIHRSENLHCLKHVNGDHEMLSGDNTDLRVLYSKSSVSRHVRSSKFKAISKGVNTDIVQTPKLFQKIQKVVKLNLPTAKECRGPTEQESLSPTTSPYNVVELDVQPSFTSLNSSKGSKRTSNSSPDLFLVPLLMLDDKMLCNLQMGDKNEKMEEIQKIEKVEETSNTPPLPVMISRQTSTTNFELLKKMDSPAKGEPEDAEIRPNGDRRMQCKSAILKEIKQLQSKLTSLISIIEMDDFSDAPNEEVVNPIKVDAVLEPPTDVIELPRNLSDKIPTVLEQYSSPASGDEMSKTSSESHTPESKLTEKFQDDVPRQIYLKTTKSISSDCLLIDTAPPITILSNRNPSMEEPKNGVTNCIYISELENRKGARLSKSATHIATDPKYLPINGLRKSLSFDFKDEKLEFYCLKKIKNNFFKFDTKPNFWIRQKGETNLDCKIGGEPFALPKNSQMKVFKLSEELETLKLSNPELESNIPFQDQEGDAKSVFSKQTIFSKMIARVPDVEVHFCNTNSEFPENNPVIEKTEIDLPVKCKATYDAINELPKTTGEVEKPATPNKTPRKGIIPMKKEVKPVKKPALQGKCKISEKPFRTEFQQELIKHKPLAGSRKFTLRGTAESKLHIDKLAKQYTSNNKIIERTTVRTRQTFQKRESPEVVYDEETKEKPVKLTPKTSPDELRKRETKKPPEVTEKLKEEQEKQEKPTEQPAKLPDSKVLVELFSKGPDKNDSSTTRLSENLESIDENSEIEEVKQDQTPNIEKVGVKSVWALTKLLLYDDGSKKIEILEASLTPPEHLTAKNSHSN